MVENVVATELTKLIANGNHRLNLYHFRTGDNKEVDFVLEKNNGQLAGIEVKKQDHVQASDFKGLKTLAQLSGDDFITGVVLYWGNEVVSFGERLGAVPIANLWY